MRERAARAQLFASRAVRTQILANGRVKQAVNGCHRTPGQLALAALHARVFLVNHINAAMAAHHAVIFIANFGGAQAVADLHDTTCIGLAKLPGLNLGKRAE